MMNGIVNKNLDFERYRSVFQNTNPFSHLVIDNFFENPEMVLEHSKKFEYRFPEDGKYLDLRWL